METTILEFFRYKRTFFEKTNNILFKKNSLFNAIVFTKKSILLYRVRETTWAARGSGLTYQNKQSILNNVFLRFL